MKSFLKPTLTSILVVMFISTSSYTQAADTNAAKKTEHTKPATAGTPAAPATEHHAKPYGGTVAAVDKTAMTITVKKKEASKTFSVTSSTKIMKADKPATFDDAVVGEECGVSYTETADGKAEARSLRLGAKSEKPKEADKKEKKAKKEKSDKPETEAAPADKQ